MTKNRSKKDLKLSQQNKIVYYFKVIIRCHNL